MSMKKIAVIPARLQATRFPKKLLEDLGGRSVIEQTYLATVGTDLFDQVWVATDSPEIAEKIKHIGGEVFLSFLWRCSTPCKSALKRPRCARALARTMPAMRSACGAGRSPSAQAESAAGHSFRRWQAAFENASLHHMKKPPGNGFGRSFSVHSNHESGHSR